MTPTFHKIDWKTLKGIISGFYLTTFVNIFPKLRYFEGRNYIQWVKGVIQYFFFPNRAINGGDILDFHKGGNLREGGVDLEKGGYDPLTNYI